MGKRMILAMLLGVGVVGQMGLRANTVLFASLPSTGVVNGAAGSATGRGFDQQWFSSTDWLSVTNSQLISETNPSIPAVYTDFIVLGPEPGTSGPLGLGSRTGWTQNLPGGSQGIGSYQIDPAALLGAEDLGPGMISASFDLRESLEFASVGLGGLGLALLALGLRPAAQAQHGAHAHGHAVVPRATSQVVLIKFHRGWFRSLKSSETPPSAFLEGRPGGLVRSIFEHFYYL